MLLVIMGLGAGCIKANVSALIAEQYQGKLRKETLKSGEVVIISPAVTIQSIYMCTSRSSNRARPGTEL
jgi:proton-dependent oligopeptide transporter, POT family